MVSTMTAAFTTIRAFFLLASAFLTPTGNANGVGLGSSIICVDSLDLIRSQEQLVLDESTSRTYILCPNTVYELADVLHQGQAYSDGQSPLRISKSNVRIRCGEDGSSDNNCILKGGVYQLGFFRVSQSDIADLEASTATPQRIENVTVQGLTFNSAGTFNILIENEGDLTIADCVFVENNNVALIFASSHKGRRLYDMLNDEIPSIGAVVEWAKRRRQETRREMQGSKSFLHLNVTHTVFLDNTIWSGSGASIDGLLTVDKGSVDIAHSIFAGTKLDNDEVLLGIIIRVDSGDLTMDHNCFVGNDERVAPVVVDGTEVHAEVSFLQRRSAAVAPTGCEFISIVKTGSLDESGFQQTEFNCMLNSQTDICAASIAKSFARKMPCERSLGSIAKNEANVEFLDRVRTYILCPDTKYIVESSIEIGQHNMHLICGINGDSNNQCVLSGGGVQVEVSDLYWTGGARVPAINVLLHGIRFERAASANVWIKYPGQFMFRDCFFSENSNLASIYIGTPSGFRSRLLDNRGRHTQAENPETINVTVERSAFVGNRVGSLLGQSTGIIINHGGTLAVTNTTFMGIEEVQIDSRFANYIIGNMDGYLELTGNCFVENKITFAPVISHSETVPLMSNNYGTATNQEQCEFAAVYQTTAGAVAVNQIGDYCVKYDGHSCTGMPTGTAKRDPQKSPDALILDSGTTSVLASHIFCVSIVLLFGAYIA